MRLQELVGGVPYDKLPVRVRRKCWLPEMFIEKRRTGGNMPGFAKFFLQTHETEYVLGEGELEANDWELVLPEKES